MTSKCYLVAHVTEMVHMTLVPHVPALGKNLRFSSVTPSKGTGVFCLVSQIPLGVKVLQFCFYLHSIDGVGNDIGTCKCSGSLQE